MNLCVDFLSSPIWGSLAFLNLYAYVSFNLGDFQPFFLEEHYLAPHSFSGTLMTGIFVIVPHIPEVLLVLFFGGGCIFSILLTFGVCVSVSCSVMSGSLTPWTVALQTLLYMEFSRQEY